MIILLGMPGVGKTTQTQLLAKSLDCPWFSMGELIRKHTSGKDRAEMLEGKIIGDEITLKILAKALKNIDIAHDQCVLEGNPRTIPQANWWLAKIKAGQVKMTGVVEMTIDVKLAESRLAGRGRSDDASLKVVHKRFKEYQRSVTPTLEYLKKHGVAVRKVDASGSIEQVARQIRASVGLDLR